MKKMRINKLFLCEFQANLEKSTGFRIMFAAANQIEKKIQEKDGNYMGGRNSVAYITRYW